MDDQTGLLARARACRKHLAALGEARASEHDRRAQLVAEMRNAGCTWPVITHALGISDAWAWEILPRGLDLAELTEPADAAGAPG
jgi:hypothetical protein